MKIFLSYATPDKSMAESIAFSLRSRGHEVFLDRDDLPAGESYDQRIERAVSNSDIFIFLISPDSVAQGRYALTELKFARRKWNHPSGRVLPVMVRTTPLQDVPSYLKAVTIMEPSGNVAAETSAAVDEIEQERRTFSVARRFVATLFAQRRYVVALGVLCAAAIASAFLLWGSSSVNPVDCKEEPILRSLEGKISTSIAFVNKEDHAIQVYWLDYNGKRVLFGTLGRGQALTQDTFVTHPWIVTNANGECKAIYMPTSKRLEVNVLD
jgi:TIR domain/VHL beta domain